MKIIEKIKGIKKKTINRNVCRAHGAMQSYIFGKIVAYPMWSLTIETMLGDYPTESKIIYGAVSCPFILGSTFLLAEGLLDLINGSYHELGMKTWRKLTRSERRRKSIDEELIMYKKLTGREEIIEE